jgi:1-deoxy-D-xylulose 5-phosphate reductoisomerase
MKHVSILGSTGSIGCQTLDVIGRHPERFRVVGLAAGRSAERLLEQIRRFRPAVVSVADKETAERVRAEAPAGVKVLYGPEGLMEVAARSGADFLVSALVGSVGLAPTLEAIREGIDIGLANKETLVAAGHLVTALAEQKRVRILPIDSEHSAIFQCLNGENPKQVRRITLTASGGSFRDRSREELRGVTVAEALRHPNWSMGAKITIDSATMVNKGLEVIEAHWLFGMPYDRIGVLIHPESIVHSFVEFEDKSVIAQLGTPDMRVPIQYALSYPERLPSAAEPLDLARIGALHFRELDLDRYRCFKYALDSAAAGGTAPAAFNAANEVAVARFLRGEIEFLRIETILEEVMNLHMPVASPDLEQILEADRWARDTAARL